MKWLSKNYKFALFLLLFGFSFFVLVRGTKKTPVLPFPSPSLAPFVINGFFPPQGEKEIALPNFALSFTFSNKLDFKTLKVLVVPFTGFGFSTNPSGNVLYVSPTTPWELNTEYKITIEAKDIYGQELPSPFVYTFKPKKVTVSDLPGEH